MKSFHKVNQQTHRANRDEDQIKAVLYEDTQTVSETTKCTDIISLNSVQVRTARHRQTLTLLK